MAVYYFITQDLDDMTTMRFSGHSKESGKRLWVSGIRFEEDYPHDTFYVAPRMGTGTVMPDFFDSSVPLMSNRLIEAIEKSGVDNIDKYPVVLKDKNTGTEWRNYSAINVIGSLDAVDQDKSIIDEEDDYIFHSTVIDESKVHDQLCFRLHKGLDLLVLDEEIAKPLMQMDLKGVLLIKTEEYDFDDYF